MKRNVLNLWGPQHVYPQTFRFLAVSFDGLHWHDSAVCLYSSHLQLMESFMHFMQLWMEKDLFCANSLKLLAFMLRSSWADESHIVRVFSSLVWVLNHSCWPVDLSLRMDLFWPVVYVTVRSMCGKLSGTCLSTTSDHISCVNSVFFSSDLCILRLLNPCVGGVSRKMFFYSDWSCFVWSSGCSNRMSEVFSGDFLPFHRLFRFFFTISLTSFLFWWDCIGIWVFEWLCEIVRPR